MNSRGRPARAFNSGAENVKFLNDQELRLSPVELHDPPPPPQSLTHASPSHRGKQFSNILTLKTIRNVTNKTCITYYTTFSRQVP